VYQSGVPLSNHGTTKVHGQVKIVTWLTKELIRFTSSMKYNDLYD
jgi:hypothetical protein